MRIYAHVKDLPNRVIGARPLLEREVYPRSLYEWGLGGFRHDDTVLVGKTPEVLTKAPKDLVSQTIN
ncbi:MAG: hypothetical protein JOZ30_17940 [Hyphomicrobiales bacterium]|nr:hypothetical protein [Hyphomicrobiales bacterium]